MTREQVFATVKQIVLDVLPEVSPEAITPDVSLRDIGANSIDRADVTTRAMEQLDVAIPLTDLAGISSLGGLVDRLHRACEHA